MSRDNDDIRAEITRRRAEIAALESEVGALEKTLGPTVSPFAPAKFPSLSPVDGVRFSAVAAGVRYTTGRLDVMLADVAPGSMVAGTFTRSSTRSAPVLWCQDRIRALGDQPVPEPMAVLVNAGNANAFTGKNGRDAVSTLAARTADVLGLPEGNVLLASTGVIGEPLPADRITDRLIDLRDTLDPGALEPAARAIMTTDTFAKGASTTVEIDGCPVTISGFAKGSGMIAPDMATMLVFVFTDAVVAPGVLQPIVAAACERTFNAITVDSDTSTSDTLLTFATGRAGNAPVTNRDGAFAEALETVFRDLSHQVVKDGEGATKFAAITVSGAEDDAAARRIGLAIANSPLVKTALAGEDPNWGRIVMAIGKSGENADRDRIGITFGPIRVAARGWVAADYREEDGADYMRRAELEIGVEIGIGQGTATVWTCDLTHGYITINADYRS